MTAEECFRALWEYLTVRDEPLRSDAIFVFGRDDFSIAEKALGLYERHAAPILVLLGGRGRLSGQLAVPESEAFRAFLSERGVPARAILSESRSTNTSENVIEGLRLLSENLIDAQRVILVTHAPHSRRALATARKRAPEIDFLSCPDDCVLAGSDAPTWISIAEELVGEVDRLSRYSHLGYIEKQVIPPLIEGCTSTLIEWLSTVESSMALQEIAGKPCSQGTTVPVFGRFEQ
jgi:hypothetical protein